MQSAPTAKTRKSIQEIVARIKKGSWLGYFDGNLKENALPDRCECGGVPDVGSRKCINCRDAESSRDADDDSTWQLCP